MSTCEACTDPIGGRASCDICKSLLTIVVRCSSHRARQKLHRLVTPIEALYSFDRGSVGGFYRIPAGYLDDARAIIGVTRTVDADDLMRCWMTSA